MYSTLRSTIIRVNNYNTQKNWSLIQRFKDSNTMQNIISSIAPVIGLGSTTESAAESGQEPRSGVKGAGTAADPYDAGNAERQLAPAGLS